MNRKIGIKITDKEIRIECCSGFNKSMHNMIVLGDDQILSFGTHDEESFLGSIRDDYGKKEDNEIFELFDEEDHGYAKKLVEASKNDIKNNTNELANVIKEKFYFHKLFSQEPYDDELDMKSIGWIGKLVKTNLGGFFTTFEYDIECLDMEKLSQEECIKLKSSIKKVLPRVKKLYINSK